MTDDVYPRATARAAKRRRSLTPKTETAFAEFSERVFAEGALPAKTKELIAIAVAHVTQCPYCIRSHTRRALRRGASAEEIMEAIWVAAEMRAGAAVAHSTIALEAMETGMRIPVANPAVTTSACAHGSSESRSPP